MIVDHGERIDDDPYLDSVAPARSERERLLHLCKILRLRPCPLCSSPLLPSRDGNGYCVPCAYPPGDVPLVPVSWSVKRFLRIRSAYEQGVREYNEDVRKWRRYLARGSKPGSLRTVTEPREDPTEADESLIPLSKDGTDRRERPPKKRGRRLALTEANLIRLAQLIKSPLWTPELIADRSPDLFGKKISARTVRRAIAKLGRKLKKPGKMYRRSRSS